MKYQQVTEKERYFISRLLRAGKSVGEIVQATARHRSTIDREIKRNRDCQGHYKPLIANDMAVFRRHDSRRTTYFSETQWALVHSKIKLDWAPEQVSLKLAKNGELSIHWATIYRHIERNKLRGGKLNRHLRQFNKKRRKGYGRSDSRGVLRGKRNIKERPEAANLRSEVGHFEVDLMQGYKAQGYVMTIVDRMSRYLRIVKLIDKTMGEVSRKLIPILKAMNAKTATVDNGCEFHDYKNVENQTGVLFYFANPHCSWERGTIENTNGLARQYFPKKESMKGVTQVYCNFAEKRLNQRPRKILDLNTPEECYHENR